MVVYKGGGRLPELAQVLAGAGRLDGAVLGELLGLPGGRVAEVAEVADRPATYLATVVVPPVRNGTTTPAPPAGGGAGSRAQRPPISRKRSAP